MCAATHNNATTWRPTRNGNHSQNDLQHRRCRKNNVGTLPQSTATVSRPALQSPAHSLSTTPTASTIQEIEVWEKRKPARVEGRECSSMTSKDQMLLFGGPLRCGDPDRFGDPRGPLGEPPLFLQAGNVAVQLSQVVRLDLFVGSVGD